MSIYDQNVALESAFPKLPYNFDTPPPQYVVGPIKSILVAANTAFTSLLSEIAAFKSQLSIQTASGIYLDAHGVLYNVSRLPGEIDGAPGTIGVPGTATGYRARILEALFAGKLTIPALQATLNNYLASTTSQYGTAPSGYVYDLQSNPGACAADAAAGNLIKMFQFVVQINLTINEDDIFFLDYSYLSNPPSSSASTNIDPLTLFTAGTSYSTTYGDPALVAAINAVKAANTQPIYKTVVAIDTSIQS